MVAQFAVGAPTGYAQGPEVAEGRADRVRQGGRPHQRPPPLRPLRPHQKDAAAPGKASVAVTHSILTSAYYMLARDAPYPDAGEDYFHRSQAERAERYNNRVVRQLERLGAGRHAPGGHSRIRPRRHFPLTPVSQLPAEIPPFIGEENSARRRARRPVLVREREQRGILKPPCGSYCDA